MRTGHLKSKLVRPPVDEARQEQGAALAEGPLVGAAVARNGGGGHEVDEDFDEEVEVGLEVGGGVDEEGLDGEEEQGLLGEAVDDGLVLVSRRGGG